MMDGMGCPGGMALFGSLLGLALLVLLVLAIVWLVRQLFGQQRHSTSGPNGALEELELRYARGEIDRDSYLAIRADLAAKRR